MACTSWTCAVAGLMLFVPNRDAGDQEKVQGDWELAAISAAGAPLPGVDLLGLTVRIKGDRLALNTTSPLIAPGTYKFTFDPAVQPAHMDLTGVDGEYAGQTFAGIYLLRADTLRACLPVTPDAAPRARTFNVPADAPYLVITLRRARAK